LAELPREGSCGTTLTTTLSVIVDDILAHPTGGIGRYTEELTRQLVNTAPDNCVVAGVVSARSAEEYRLIEDLLPGLEFLEKSSLPRRELRAAWQRGMMRPRTGGLIHATSLMAPLGRHDRRRVHGSQSVVTIHNARPWTHPQSMAPADRAFATAMAARAHRYADAVVVPTHAVADELEEAMHFGDRLRVIGAAVGSKLLLPPDAQQRATRLGLPEKYVLTVGNADEHRGLGSLITSLTLPGDAGLPLLIAGPSTAAEDVALSELVSRAGLDASRVRPIGRLDDEDLAVALDRATVFAYPALTEGFALPILEAFHFGVPVVHSDAAALVEVAGGAGITVPIGSPTDSAGYASRLAGAIASVVNDAPLSQKLSYAGYDRAGVFSWRGAAQRIWELHADL
jgi:glycosyltransferase involved in cell wall biosynthesis